MYPASDNMCMKVLTLDGWEDYELLDSGDGRRLERFGSFVLSRPDPQTIWLPALSEGDWENADATYRKSDSETSGWDTKPRMPTQWIVRYKKLTFQVKLSPFKHTGIFPEQSLHWDWMQNLIKKAKRPIRVLNLFGYTGGATLAAAAAGATVTHVDASFPTIGWGRQNQQLSGLQDAPIRWIEDDCLRFVSREIRRGSQYDAIILDPPAYGRGPKGETWIFNSNFPGLMQECIKILSDTPLFLIVNAYAISSSSIMLENVLGDHLRGGIMESGELAISEKSAGRLLSTGIYARWQND
jgi:23S rRNA (cytosine1962-C5)-methyltransferase